MAGCNDHHELITREEVEKLRYVMSVMKLQHKRKWKSCGKYT